MRVLLVNKFYYPRGGDCMVTMGTERLLREHGHEVAVFAMQYDQNIDAATSRYFASEVSFAGGIGSKLKALRRTMGWGDVKTSFSALLRDFKPDVVHLHNIHSYLSPVVAKLAHKSGARVVWTMHDYKLMCPAYTCLRGGNPCELCIAGGKSNVLKLRCMKGSLVASTVAWFEALKWKRKTLERYTDAFICPSEFMAGMMRKAGFDAKKIEVLNNFITYVPQDTAARSDYYCYVGRLSPEKGVETLLETASRLPHKLKVAGTGPLEDVLRARYGHCDNIEFMGHLGADQVAHLLQGARASVVPSQWYENNPLSVIESLCAGTPVVGTDMGGIPELITYDNGIVTEINGLGEAINAAMTRQWDHAGIAAESRKKFSPESHLQQLLHIYGQK